MPWFVLVVTAVAAERIAELVVARRNARWSRDRGAVETGSRHYIVMVALHSTLLLAAPLEAYLVPRPFVPELGWPMLAVVVGAQGLRWWCIATLGRQWNTRILVVPGARRVSRGPYALLDHPNYVAVVLEGAALPLVHTAWVTAVCFTVANAALLRVRVRAENVALHRAA